MDHYTSEISVGKQHSRLTDGVHLLIALMAFGILKLSQKAVVNCFSCTFYF